MCRECHNNFTNGEVVRQLQLVVRNPDFEMWNTTSVSHLLIAASGRNGTHASNLANTLLDNFEIFLQGKPNKYLPRTGLEPMYSIAELQQLRQMQD